MTELANAGADAIEQSVDTVTNDAVVETSTEATAAEPEQKAAETDVDFAARIKKLENALSHKDRLIGKKTAQRYQVEAENRQLKEQLAKYNSPQQTEASTPPDESKFDDYTKYVKALASWEAKNIVSENEKKRQTEQQNVSQNTYLSERYAHMDENDIAAKEAFSDFEVVFNENKDLAAEMPEHIKQAFLEAENPSFAFYSLAKEGKLESMLNMSQFQAVALIARYEDKAIALSKAKQVTKAPTPLTPGKGTAVGSKSLESMSGEELLKWVRNK